MPSLLPNGPDPNGLYEYSVVYTDRALNHMSVEFKQVMKTLNNSKKKYIMLMLLLLYLVVVHMLWKL